MEGEERPKRVIQEHRLGFCTVTRGLTPAQAPPAVRIRHRAPSRAVTYSTFPDQSFPPERGCGRTAGLSCTPVGVSGLRGTPGCADCSGRSTTSPAPGDAALMLRVKGWLQAPAGLGAAREDSAQPPRFRSCHQASDACQHQVTIRRDGPWWWSDISQRRQQLHRYLLMLITIYSPIQSPWPSIHPASASLPLRNAAGRSFTDPHPVSLPPRRLDANLISVVPDTSFEGLLSLRHLWLDDNALTEIPVRALNHLPALQAMTLALNQIWHIPDFAFQNLSSLVVL